MGYFSKYRSRWLFKLAFFGLVIISGSHQAFGAAAFTGLVRLYNGKAGVEALVGNVLVEASQGSSSAPHQAYIPLDDSDASGEVFESEQNILSTESGVALPLKSEAYIGVELTNTSTTQDLYIYVSVEGDSATEYRPVLHIPADPSQVPQYDHILGRGLTQTYYFSLTNLCQADTDCQNWSDSSDIPVGSDVNVFIYADINPGRSSVIDPSDFSSSGFFLDLNASSQLETKGNSPGLGEIYRGDTQLILSLENNNATIISDGHYRTIVGRTASAQGIQMRFDTFLGQAAEFLDGGRYKLLDPVIEGLVVVSGLENEVGHFLTIGQVNKYQFTTWLSPTNSTAAVPSEIEAFLQAKSCFLLSAAFKRDHYLIEYFRRFRDRVLKQHPLGVMFVNSYYQYAPQYTSFIWNSPALQLVIKIFAYLLYFLLNFKLLFMSIILTCAGAMTWLRRKNS
jgi:hypothetical protein